MDRQKILIIFGAAWLSAALLTWLFIARTHGAKAQSTRRIVVAARDMPIGTRVRKPDIRIVEALDRNLPKGSLFEEKEVIDRALLFPVAANEPLTNFKLTSNGGADGIPSTIEAGMRAISMQISDT